MYGLLCGYNISPAPDAPAAPDNASVAAVPDVPTVVDVTGIPNIAAVTTVTTIVAVPAPVLAQYDLPRHFQPKIDNMDLNIYNTISKQKVFL